MPSYDQLFRTIETYDKMTIAYLTVSLLPQDMGAVLSAVILERSKLLFG